MPNRPSITIKKENWPLIIEFAHQQLNHQLPYYQCFIQFSCCPVGIISMLSVTLLGLYKNLAGVSRLRTPAEFYDLPALYVDAVNVIETELHRHDKKAAVSGSKSRTN